MIKPKSYRWSPILANEISNHQVQMGFKTDKEAVADLIRRGLRSNSSAAATSSGTDRAAILSELRAIQKAMEGTAGQIATDPVNETVRQLLDVEAAVKGVRQMLCGADKLADFAGTMCSSPELKECARLLDVWSVAYETAALYTTSDTTRAQFKNYLAAVNAAKDLLRRLGIGNSIHEEIEVQRLLVSSP